MPRPAEGIECGDVRERLETLIDGGLDETEAVAISRHVAACPACREELELTRQVHEALQSLPEHEIPGHVIDGALAAVEGVGGATGEQRPLGSFAIRPLQTFLAVAAAVLLMVVVAPRREMPGPQTGNIEVERVTAETRLALAYLGDAAQRAEHQVTAHLAKDGALNATAKSISRTLSLVRRTAGGQAPIDD